MQKLFKSFSKFIKKIAVLVLLVICLLFNEACAIFGGGSEINRARSYDLQAPNDWKPSNDYGESDKAYTLPSGNLVTVTSSCGHSKSRTLEVETKHLLMGARNIIIKKRYPLNVGEYTGLYSSTSASMEGKGLNLEICVLKKENCVFDFVLLSPKEISTTEHESFINFIKSIKSGTN